MKKLLKYLVKEITGSDDFSIEESSDQNQENYEIKAGQEIIGMIIGKGGQTIKSIRNLLRVRAVLKKKTVFVSVSEK